MVFLPLRDLSWGEIYQQRDGLQFIINLVELNIINNYMRSEIIILKKAKMIFKR